MIFVWRRWGWLVLVFLLLVYGLADFVITPITRQVTGDLEPFNANRGIAWAVSFFVIGGLLYLFNVWALRSERVQPTPEAWAVRQKKLVRAHNLIHANDQTHEERKVFTDQIRAQPIPPLNKSSHAFFIPMKVFPFIFAGAGILLLVINIPIALR